MIFKQPTIPLSMGRIEIRPTFMRAESKLVLGTPYSLINLRVFVSKTLTITRVNTDQYLRNIHQYLVVSGQKVLASISPSQPDPFTALRALQLLVVPVPGACVCLSFPVPSSLHCR